MCDLKAFTSQFKEGSQCVCSHSSILADLGWICAIGIVGDHVDGHVELRELDEGLVFVCTNIELGLDNGAKGRAKLSQLLLCCFVWQIPNMKHLRRLEMRLSQIFFQ